MKKFILVEFKFEGEARIYKKHLTQSQYDNFKILPIVEYCEIIKE